MPAGATRRFTSVLGALTLERAYYHCDACETGFCPRDAALGVEGASLSPGVTRMVGQVGAMVSFEEGHELLRELAGVDVAPKHVERAAEALGREIAEDERRVVEPPAAPGAPTLYLGMDGTGVPMRASELAGRAGKQPDGSSKTREVKLCTVWSAEGRDEEGTPVRDEGSVTYSAAIESAASRTPTRCPARSPRGSCARPRAAASTQRPAPRRAGRRGAVDLEPRHRALPRRHPDRRPLPRQAAPLGRGQVHLRGDQRPRRARGPRAARRTGRRRHRRRPGALATHAATNDEARKCVDYVERNRERMRYPEFRAAGLCTSTGVVEAGCKVAIGTRLQARRHALDRRRCRRHHRPAMLQAQRPLRGLLGAPAQRLGPWPHDLISQS